jgi:rsbT co-antagonist protein RsbR
VDVSTSNRFAELLKGNQERLIKRWTTGVATSLRGRLGEAEIGRQIHELFSALRTAADADGELALASPAATELRAVLTELSRQRARLGFTTTETVSSVFVLKDAALELLEHADPEALRLYISIAQLVDEMGMYTFEAYAKTREELIADQAEQLLELSTPVVKLWHGVVAVPLVGTLDSSRAQVVMERLLQTLVDTSSPYAIIDITGVPAVDTQVAQHILKTVVAARLMGADCVISGIRPQIAQTIVALGIEFGDIVTKATLADALMHVLRLDGFELNRRSGKRD